MYITSLTESLYYFRDNDRVAWKELFSLYQLPLSPYHFPKLEPVLSFGLATCSTLNSEVMHVLIFRNTRDSYIMMYSSPGTGVPFHVHSSTFAETIYGRYCYTSFKG